ncbi:MAG: hypothetical protein ACD_74C00201G0001 [uncultured bacterium]|nr:MAG: hypothetical protein ACD_74C00201G0001 [uncultured bacterium]
MTWAALWRKISKASGLSMVMGAKAASAVRGMERSTSLSSNRAAMVCLRSLLETSSFRASATVVPAGIVFCSPEGRVRDISVMVVGSAFPQMHKQKQAH